MVLLDTASYVSLQVVTTFIYGRTGNPALSTPYNMPFNLFIANEAHLIEIMYLHIMHTHHLQRRPRWLRYQRPRLGNDIPPT